MTARGIEGKVADEIFGKMAAFSSFGFPESHAVSFAHLVYASAWLKLHHPAAFTAALLNSQPMGFWSPRSLVADARRHGVVVHRAEVNTSGVEAGLEPTDDPATPAVRLGLLGVRTLGEAAARVVAGQPYRDLEDLARRAELTGPQLEALATAGATASLDGGDRRAALWAAGPLAELDPGRLEGIVVGTRPPPLPPMDRVEETVADLWATGLSVDSSLTELVRDELDRLGVVTAAGLATVTDGTRVTVAGVVTHRQRPETARGITFVNLEDETGLVNVVCSVGVWARHRRVAQGAPALMIRGTVESSHGVVNVVAERIRPLPLAAPTTSRDFS